MINYQTTETGLFSDHFNLLRAQFSDNHPVTHYFHPKLNLGNISHDYGLVDKEIRSLLLSGNYAKCLKFIELIPFDVFEQVPIIFIYKAIAMFHCNFTNESIQELLFKAQKRDQGQQIQGEIIALKALIHSYLGDQELGIQLSLKALGKIPEENLFFRNLIQRNLGIAYSIKGDLRKAAMWYENLLLSSHKLQNNDGILAAYNHITYIRKAQGRLKNASVIYTKALNFIKENQLENFPHSIKIISGYGQLLIQWHEIEQAKTYLLKAIRFAKKSDILLAQKAYQALSEVYIREHDLRSALANIQECRQQIQQNNSKYFDLFNQSLLATEARIHLEAGKLDEADAWLTSSGFDDVSPQDLYLKFGDQLGYLLPIAVRIYLAKNMEDKATNALKATIPKYLHAGANTYLIRALNALAVTYKKIGDTTKAIKALTKSVELGKPENNFGEFIFIGQDLMPLLYEIIQSGIETEFCRKLLSLFSDLKDQRPSTTHLINNIDPLSNRELDVLQLIAQGMTNREIAGSLFLSTNTIKSHSIKIYRKLKVSNRNQAVSKARLLGILPAQRSPRYLTSA